MHSHGLTTRDCPLCGLSVFAHRDRDYVPVNAPDLIIGNLADRKAAAPIPGSTSTGGTFAYVPHVCSPAEVERHDQTRVLALQKLEELIEVVPNDQVDPQWQHRMTSQLIRVQGEQLEAQRILTEMIYTDGLTRPCPKCLAELGQPCENLTSRRRGIVEVTKNPHPDRLPKVDFETVQPQSTTDRMLKRQIEKRNALLHQITNLNADMARSQKIEDVARLRDEVRHIVESIR